MSPTRGDAHSPGRRNSPIVLHATNIRGYVSECSAALIHEQVQGIREFANISSEHVFPAQHRAPARPIASGVRLTLLKQNVASCDHNCGMRDNMSGHFPFCNYVLVFSMLILRVAGR